MNRACTSAEQGSIFHHNCEIEYAGGAALERVDELCHLLYDYKNKGLACYGLPLFSRCFNLVKDTINLLSDSEAEYLIGQAAGLVPRIKFIRSRLTDWTSDFEKQASREFISSRFLHPYLTDVNSKVDLEATSSSVDRHSNIVFIGSGHFPESAIRLVKQTGAKLTCCDIWSEAVGYSKEIIRGLRLPIRAIQADGATCAVNGFSHIWIASLVPNKLQVMQNIVRNAGNGTIVVLRYGNLLKELFNYPLPPCNLANLRPLADLRGILCDSLILRLEK